MKSVENETIFSNQPKPFINSRKLMVEFDSNKEAILKEWKELVQIINPVHGAQKARIQELIEKDLKLLRHGVSDGFNRSK